MKIKEARAMVEKKLLAEALDATQGNIMKAAEALGVSRPTLYDLMKKHNFILENIEE
jgi:two-component system NtrC family response regulator